mmetsp:Transcript_45301/g.137995  ORF Transcript_45301/g.137995 Transcript_45301/m.137995 type:complete len:89 (+) Transcript_45301:248-514(+)
MDESFDESKVECLYRRVFEDLSVDQEENTELLHFFGKENRPPKSRLIWTRAAAFRIGCEFLSDDKKRNVSLLRCINVVVHDFETTCLL